MIKTLNKDYQFFKMLLKKQIIQSKIQKFKRKKILLKLLQKTKLI